MKPEYKIGDTFTELLFPNVKHVKIIYISPKIDCMGEFVYFCEVVYCENKSLHYSTYTETDLEYDYKMLPKMYLNCFHEGCEEMS